MPIENRKIPIYPSTVVRYGNYIYYAHGMINAIFKYDLKNKRNQYIGFIPEIRMVGEYPLFGHAILVGDRIYFIPLHGEKIGVLDVENENIYTIDLPQSVSDKSSKYVYACMYNNYLYMIPYLMNTNVLKMNLNTNLFETLPIFEKYINAGRGFIDSACLYNEYTCVCVIGEVNQIVIVDLCKEKIVFKRTMDFKMGSVFVIDGRIFVSCVDSQLVYELKPTELDIIGSIDMGGINGYLCGLGMHLIKDSKNESILYVYDAKNKETKQLTYSISSEKSIYDYPYGVGIPFGCYKNEKLYFERKGYCLIDIISGKKYPVTVSNEDLKKIRESIIVDGSQVVNVESALLRLEDFIKYEILG